MRKKYSISTIFALIVLFGFSTLNIAGAYVSSSTNYRLESDSVNIGGLLSTSTNYRLEDTVGEVGTGTSTSATFSLKGGYQQMATSYIAVSSPTDVTLSPGIPSTGGGTSNGSSTWLVTTDNTAGYTMTIQAAASPALFSGGNNFNDYTPAGAVPDFTFTMATTTSEFGFSPEGGDIVQRYLDNGVACGVGAGDVTDRCWDAFAIVPTTIAERTTGNHPFGTQTRVKYRAQSGTGNTQPAGAYSASVIVTVLPR